MLSGLNAVSDRPYTGNPHRPALLRTSWRAYTMSSTWKTDLLASLKESSIVPDVLPEDLDLTVKVSIQYGSSEPLTNGEIVVAGDKTKEGPIVRAEGTVSNYGYYMYY
jgi:hypothetical protein